MTKTYSEFEKASMEEDYRIIVPFLVYSNNPAILNQLVLAAYEGIPQNIRKFIVVVDQNDYQILHFDFQEKLTPSLYELTGLKESSEK